MMKKLLLAASIAALVSGCSTTGSFQAQQAAVDEKRERAVEHAISKAPDWMTKLPKEAGVIYANGSARSTDFSMADEKAKMFAFGRICMAAGGEVDKQGKMFRSDSGDVSTDTSEVAIRELCRRVDITGTEVVEIKRVSEGQFYRTYVLVALPTGDANQLRKDRDTQALNKDIELRKDRAFKELDQKIAQ
jgi:hypothetical protein